MRYQIMKLAFTKEAEEFLAKKVSKSKKRLNLVFHAKEVNKNCYKKLEPEISFETDENYLDGIDKIGDWMKQIDLFIDPVIKPLLQNENEIQISLQGRLFKSLHVDEGKSQITVKCSIC